VALCASVRAAATSRHAGSRSTPPFDAVGGRTGSSALGGSASAVRVPSAVRVHGVGKAQVPPICRSVWLNGARTMSIMVVDPVRRPLGCCIPALLLVLTTASLQRFPSRSLVPMHRPLLRHQDQLCQESHPVSSRRSLSDDLETTVLITLGAVVPSCTPWPVLC
jgi:hypothetical protein